MVEAKENKRRKPASERREDIIRIRVTASQKKRLAQAAKAAGLDLSAWIRAIALRAAEAVG